MKHAKASMILSGIAFALSIFSLIYALTACGDNIEPPHTWRDAENAWSSDWCDLVARCQPDLYRKNFVDAADCLAFVLDDNCAPKGPRDCDVLYTKPWYLVEECDADMTQLPCDVAVAPPSCYAAFSP